MDEGSPELNENPNDPHLYEVRYKKIMVESVITYAKNPTAALEKVNKGEFSSTGAKIWNRYPIIEAFLVQENGRDLINKTIEDERHDAAIREDERKRVCGLVRCLIEHAGYSCGETDHILEYLNEIGPTAPAPGNREK